MLNVHNIVTVTCLTCLTKKNWQRSKVKAAGHLGHVKFKTRIAQRVLKIETPNKVHSVVHVIGYLNIYSV